MVVEDVKIIGSKGKPLQVHPDSRELAYFIKPPERMQLLVPAGQFDHLYRNLGDFHFEDVTTIMGINPAGMWSSGATFADINNDGWLDLYVCGFDCPNRLYINQQGKFTEEAGVHGLDFHGASVVMSFADYDLDGDLDGYLLTNRLHPSDAIRNVKILNQKKPATPCSPRQSRTGIFYKTPQSHPTVSSCRSI